MERYKNISKRSFKTKLNIFLYSLAINEIEHIDENEFLSFELEQNKDLINDYATVYFQQERDAVIINNMNVDDIYFAIEKLKKENTSLINDLEKKYLAGFEKVFKKEDFEEVVKKGKCCYCDITKKEIENLIDNKQVFKKSNRGFDLEIERFNSNLEYTKNNCDLACYWCNNAKTDEFTKEEFMLIAQEIKKVWIKRKTK